EGIAYAFRYGIDIMREVGVEPKVIRAGKANLFLSPLFRRTLATLCDARIELYNTDGALGAARGAALGAGLYKNREEAFASLRKLETIEPDNAMKAALEHGYQIWKRELNNKLMLF
ncbi:MAG: carbohydrate kinase, partial [Rikenellaceae bacterium]